MKFLETLRQSPDDEYENTNNEKTNDVNTEEPHHGDGDYALDLKERKMSLKQSLEMLLVKYLHKLSPADEEDYNSIRSRRNLMNSSSALVLFEDGGLNSTDIIDSENEWNDSSSSAANSNPTTTSEVFDNSVDYVTDYSDKIVNESFNQKLSRVILGEKNISVLENGRDQYGNERNEKNRSSINRKICEVRKRRIAQLDRFELEKSYEQDSSEELNIRKVLNYR